MEFSFGPCDYTSEPKHFTKANKEQPGTLSIRLLIDVHWGVYEELSI